MSWRVFSPEFVGLILPRISGRECARNQLGYSDLNQLRNFAPNQLEASVWTQWDRKSGEGFGLESVIFPGFNWKEFICNWLWPFFLEDIVPGIS